MTLLAKRLSLFLLCPLAACSGLYGVRIGPPDLDTTSAAAPRCTTVGYPPKDIVMGNTGTVVVRARVNAQGAVTDAAVESPSVYTALNESALQAATHACRFEPSPPPAGASARTVRITFVYALISSFGLTDQPVVKVGVQPSLQSAP